MRKYSSPSVAIHAKRSDKKITKTNELDPRKSGDLLRDLVDLLNVRASAAPTTTIVGDASIPPALAPTEPLAAPHTAPSLVPSVLDLISLNRGKSPFNLPISGRGQDAEGLPEHDPKRALKPGKWRHQTDQIKALCYHLAMKRLAQRENKLVAAVTIRLSDEVEAKARAKGYQCTAWLYSECMRRLTKVYGYNPHFLMITEEVNGEGLHIHGELTIERHQSGWQQEQHERAVRRALRQAAGEWDGDARKYQVFFQRNKDGTLLQPNAGWIGYAGKGLAKSKDSYRRWMKRMGVSYRWFNRFDGSAIACGHPLSREAKAIYSEAVRQVLAYRASL